MHDLEDVVSGLAKIRDKIQNIDESCTLAHLVRLALHEAMVLAWDAVLRDPDEKRRAARFFRLYAVMPKD